mmetsp:Transcript_23562/g.65390  ORF Transcript_23562/g.65390 Transcript_23562/m.65390 type:complete len:472 (+) Transcript_23562:158-1573(+)
MMFKAACALVFGTFVAVSAVKDDEYYRAGMGNPNVDLKMYWADAHNVIQDLDQFSYLYIQYHNCAWTQNRNVYTEQESGSGDENDYWYMGATPSYAANVAFSLYGSLQGESFSGCNENTFINSFTTNQGFEAFASSLYYAGATGTDYSQTYSSECQGGAGVACDSSVGFAYVSYSTDTCDPAYATGVTDTMSYMNSVFQAAQCVKIYDSSQSYNNNNYNNYNYNVNNYNNNYGNRDLKEEENKQKMEKDSKIEDSESSNNENADTKERNLQNNYGYGYGYNNGYNGNYAYGYNTYYTYAGTALSILYYSNACFIQNYWDPDGGCPDPYGKLQYYQQNFNKGVRKSMKVDTYVNYRANMQLGKRYVKSGAVLFMTAVVLFLAEQLLAFKARKRARRTKTSDSLMKRRKERSVVRLVSKTGGRVKKSAVTSVKKVVDKVNKVSQKTRCVDDSNVVDKLELDGDDNSAFMAANN